MFCGPGNVAVRTFKGALLHSIFIFSLYNNHPKPNLLLWHCSMAHMEPSRQRERRNIYYCKHRALIASFGISQVKRDDPLFLSLSLSRCILGLAVIVVEKLHLEPGDVSVAPHSRRPWGDLLFRD